ncbi:hypothetical protein P167DRAFT_76973 [Morchella conica CCBAS932]|uniref:Uncharacterized protein n=1 Tax=Morchella conica CCBAS932 TaxID=1392247 RepID=A0A3N4KUF3_9PEZI|nr:hypothetical protein P167DRAFT_76973 [Morchella conica CCBAS932]
MLCVLCVRKKHGWRGRKNVDERAPWSRGEFFLLLGSRASTYVTLRLCLGGTSSYVVFGFRLQTVFYGRGGLSVMLVACSTIPVGCGTYDRTKFC